MSLTRDAVYGLYGAYRLARFDRAGLSYFDGTREGALRSFRALWIVIPGFLLLMMLVRLEDGASLGSLLGVALLKIVGQVISLFAYLLAVFHLLELWGKADRFATYVSVYNWANVVQVGLLLATYAVMKSFNADESMALLLSMLVSFALLAYQWFIARWSLAADWLGALGYVALDALVTLIVGNLTDVVVLRSQGG